MNKMKRLPHVSDCFVDEIDPWTGFAFVNSKSNSTLAAWLVVPLPRTRSPFIWSRVRDPVRFRCETTPIAPIGNAHEQKTPQCAKCGSAELFPRKNSRRAPCRQETPCKSQTADCSWSPQKAHFTSELKGDIRGSNRLLIASAPS